MEIYIESKNGIYRCGLRTNDFSEVSNRILNSMGDWANEVMFYQIVYEKEELIYVKYGKKIVKRGELTINILKEIQSKNRAESELAKLVSNFNLINE